MENQRIALEKAARFYLYLKKKFATNKCTNEDIRAAISICKSFPRELFVASIFWGLFNNGDMKRLVLFHNGVSELVVEEAHLHQNFQQQSEFEKVIRVLLLEKEND